MFKKGSLFLLLTLLVLALIATAFFWFQGRRTPTGNPEYVALGSSFAAGAGLGALQDGSPLLCARSINGYPPRLAKLTGLSIVDMSCGGAQTKHLLYGGQFFQGPQIRTITKATRLVTITIGGNDLGYIGDLSMLAARNSGSAFGSGVRHFWGGPRQHKADDYTKLQSDLERLIGMIHKRAPDAVVVIATYPTILPPTGSCANIGLSNAEADRMRAVADQFAAVSRAAAEKAGAMLVDMQTLGAEHHACSAQPWTYGWANAGKAPFHPTMAGAQATAEAIALALRESPAAIAAIGKHDAAGHQAGGIGGKEGDD